MSRGARITLGVCMLLLASGFLSLPPYVIEVAPNAPPMMYACGLFCGVVALACLSNVSQPITIRIIGGIVLLLSIHYVISQIREFTSADDQLRRAEIGSGPSILRSLFFFTVFGLPSAYATWKGRYPGWGQHANAFGADHHEG